MLRVIRSPTVAASALRRPQQRGFSGSSAAALNHCVELVRSSDRERYICNLHAPVEARPGLFALHAFNLETARIRSSTTAEAAAQGRFAWWRRALDQALAGTPPEHPVAAALSHAHAKYRFTARYLTQSLDAREAAWSPLSTASVWHVRRRRSTHSTRSRAPRQDCWAAARPTRGAPARTHSTSRCTPSFRPAPTSDTQAWRARLGSELGRCRHGNRLPRTCLVTWNMERWGTR